MKSNLFPTVPEARRLFKNLRPSGLFVLLFVANPIFSQCETCRVDTAYVKKHLATNRWEVHPNDWKDKLFVQVSAGAEARGKIKKWLESFLLTENGRNWIKSMLPNNTSAMNLATSSKYELEIVRTDKRGFYLDRAAN